MKLSIPKKAIEAIDFLPEGDGEAGWVIYLKPGWSFDPGSDDGSRFIPADNPSEAEDLIVHQIA